MSKKPIHTGVAIAFRLAVIGGVFIATGIKQAVRAADAQPIEQTNKYERLASAYKQPFVGKIMFRFEVLDATTLVQEISQNGVVYWGSNHEMRLDVDLKDGQSPIICTIHDGKAWMVFSEMRHSIEGRVPVPKSNDGWLNQLRAQVDQTSSWCSLLSLKVLGDVGCAGLAERKSKELSLNRTVGGVAADQVTDVNISLDDARRFLIVEIQMGPDVVKVSDFRNVFSGAVLPHLYEKWTRNYNGNPKIMRWTIEEYAEATDSGFDQCFMPPSEARDNWPSLEGQITIDDSGRESPTLWFRAKRQQK